MRNESGPEFVALICGLALGCLLTEPRPARAGRIAVLADAQGHKTYVNGPDDSQPASDPLHLSFDALSTSSDMRRLIRETASRFGVDPGLVHAVIRVESDYNPRARSAKGALGLMQLIPSTARRFGVESPMDPGQNIEGGVGYLSHLLDLFGGDVPLSLAAYNAGENSVLRRGAIPPFRETREYVRKVTTLYGQESGVGNQGSGKSQDSGSSIRDSASEIRSQSNSVHRMPLLKTPIYRYVDAQGLTHFEQ